MAEDDTWRQDLLTKGLFVVVGLGYVTAGPPLFGLEPTFIGSALAAYGVVSFLGKRVIVRWGLLER